MDCRRAKMHFTDPPRTAIYSAVSAGDAETSEDARPEDADRGGREKNAELIKKLKVRQLKSKLVGLCEVTRGAGKREGDGDSGKKGGILWSVLVWWKDDGIVGLYRAEEN